MDLNAQVLLNWSDTLQSITFNLSDISLVSADVIDVWTGTDLGSITGSYTASIEAHGALVYQFSNVKQTVPYQFTTYLAIASSNVLAGGATLRAINSTANVIGYIGHGGTLTFINVDGGTHGGMKLLSLAYVNADYTFSNTDCSNCRRAHVSVNGRTPVVVEMPISGQVCVMARVVGTMD